MSWLRPQVQDLKQDLGPSQNPNIAMASLRLVLTLCLSNMCFFMVIGLGLFDSRAHADTQMVNAKAAIAPKVIVPQIAKEAVSGDISRVGDSIHLEFRGAKDWQYDLQRKDYADKTVVEVTVPRLSDSSILGIKGWKDDILIKSVEVSSPDFEPTSVIRFQLQDSQVESFDYLTEKPSRLMVDFYLSKKSTKELAKVPAYGAMPQKVLAPSKKVRSPAGDEFKKLEEPTPTGEAVPLHGIFDGGDPKFERFTIKDYEVNEGSQLRSLENLYIEFPMLMVDGDHYEKILASPPLYSIEVKENDTEGLSEAKFAKLALTLFEKKRYSVALKTMAWFQARHPNSRYSELLAFLKADTHFKLWEEAKPALAKGQFEVMQDAYRQAIEKFPKSPLADRSTFILGYASYLNKDFLTAIQTFQKFMKNHEPSLVRDKAALGLARSLMRARLFDDADQAYVDTVDKGFKEETRVEAQFLRPDVFLMKKEYSTAADLYQKAILKNPNQAGQFPNAYYNQADCFFWMKEYRKSLNTYLDFVQKFPGSSHASFAMTRLGELLDILGAPTNKVVGAYLETSFRYGGTPGATVARMRILSKRLPQMKGKEGESAVEEIRVLAKDLDLPKMSLFATTLIANGQFARNDFNAALETILGWYQANPTTLDSALIHRRVETLVNEKMNYELENGEFIQVLKTHQKFAELWLKDSKRIDTFYVLGRAFEMAGAYKSAGNLYQETFNRLATVNASGEAKSHNLLEHLPAVEQITLRLAKTDYLENNLPRAYLRLQQIKEVKKLSTEEQVERASLAADIFESKVEPEVAARYLRELIENWKGEAPLLLPPMLRLSQIYQHEKKVTEAIQILTKANEILADSGQIPSNSEAQVLKKLSELYDTKKDGENKIRTLEGLLAKYESNEPLDSYRYKLGLQYFDDGSMQKATEVWGRLKKDKPTFWSKLAQEKLQDQDWRGSYKKYLSRIPAMAATGTPAKPQGTNLPKDDSKQDGKQDGKQNNNKEIKP